MCTVYLETVEKSSLESWERDWYTVLYMTKLLAKYAFQLSLIIATFALIGSLYFSNVLGFPPCELCWYQRIALYPLVPLFIIAIQRGDAGAWYYAMPLVLFGLGVSTYQNLLYYDIVQKEIEQCGVSGVSCTEQYVQLFGFVDIPLLALLALLAIFVLLVLYKKYRLVD